MNNRELGRTQPGNMTAMMLCQSELLKRQKSERWLRSKGVIPRPAHPSLLLGASHVSGASEGQKKASDPLELGLQGVWSQHRVLGIKPGPLGEQQCS